MAGTAWGAGPFSHKLHLQLKLTCQQCHAAAARSQNASDNLLPAESVCKPCHASGVPTPIKAPRKGTVTKFNHSKHVPLGKTIALSIVTALDKKTYLGHPPANIREQLAAANDACTSCHRGLSQNVKVDASVFPPMSDCLVCHNKVEPPFSCSTCHDQPSAKLMPASHDDKWLDFHATGKAGFDKVSCQPCHGVKFTCRGCH